jgi:SGNH domain (fused to AT3 domains)
MIERDHGSIARARRRWTLVAVLAASAFATGLIADSHPSLAQHARAAATPRCFGAAARDPRHPCENRRLARSVRPSLSDALITPNAPCETIELDGPSSFAGGLSVCAFGVAQQRAVGTVALVGDSHAMNRRAPLEVVAQAKRWRALSITRSHCPLSRAVPQLPTADRRGCQKWNRTVTRWFGRHPEVPVVFVSEQSRPLLARRGPVAFAAQVTGYRRAWRALPKSVKHIVVMRDNPQISIRTFDCIRRAVAAHRSPGRACALPRRRALLRDPAAVAAARSRSARVHLVDLTRFMCGRRLCYPVVGGVLVNKDQGHLTTLFATTLGPFLLREVNRLMSSWR